MRDPAGLGARRSALGNGVWMLAGGLVGSAAVLGLWPAGWLLGFFGMVIAAVGMKHLAEQARGDGGGAAFVALRWTAVAIAGAAALAIALAVLDLLIGGHW